MNTMELATALGEAIKNDEVLLSYDKAKAEYEANAEVQEKLRIYNAQRAALTEEFNKEIEEQNADTIKALKETMDKLGAEIVAYPEYKNFEAAQKRVTTFMNEINAEITRVAFGVEPSSCTHDCSTCSGCH
ncbi:MAG: YlbF family regulator [Eubacteriales bacterium]|nr:YlbF family regulator [Eubacteriales bacterium]